MRFANWAATSRLRGGNAESPPKTWPPGCSLAAPPSGGWNVETRLFPSERWRRRPSSCRFTAVLPTLRRRRLTRSPSASMNAGFQSESAARNHECGGPYRLGRRDASRRTGHTAEHSQAVSFEYAAEWLSRPDAFAIDPTSLPLRPGGHHSPILVGALQDCGPDRWGRMLIERAVRKHVLARKPYQDLDYVMALDDTTRIGALRFRAAPDGPFIAAREEKIPPLVQLSSLLHATDAVHGESETAKDLRYLLAQARPSAGHGKIGHRPGRWTTCHRKISQARRHPGYCGG